jgi:cobalt-zinc-cadmium efflux system outer membrane protein
LIKRRLFIMVCACALTATLAQSQTSPATPLTFAQVVALANASDPTLRVSEAVLGQARAELAAARVFPGTAIEIESRRAKSADARGAESTFAINQPIDLFNKRGTRREAATAQMEIADSARDAARLLFRSVLRAAYTEVLALDRAVPAAREDLDTLDSVERLVNRRADLGETREVDRLRIQIERQRAADRVEQLELAWTAARSILRLLAGPSLPESFELADPQGIPVSTSLDATTASVASRHPRIRIADATVRQQQALLRLAELNRYPEPSVGVFHSDELDKIATGIRLGVSFPSWGTNRALVAAARAALDRARAERAVAVRDLTREVTEQHFAREALVRRVLRLQKELLPRAAELTRIARFAYEQGETSQLEFLDAQRTSVAMRQEYLETLRNLAAVESRLEQLIGEPTDAALPQ